MAEEKKEERKVSRRSYVRYAAAGVVIVAGAAAGAYFATRPPTPVPTVTTTTPTTTGPVPIIGGTLVVEGVRTPSTVDPAYALMEDDEPVVFNVYQTLVAYKDGTKIEIVPFLAESYDISPDGLTYTFKVRKGIRFSNEDPLNAYCFWHSFYRVGLLETWSAWMLTLGLGDAYWERDGITAEMLSKWSNADNTPPADQVDLVKDPKLHIYCPDPYTLVLRLDKVFSPFFPTFTQPHSAAMSPRWVTEHGGVVAGTPNEYVNLNAMGSGPFLLTRYEPEIQTVLEKNPNYWGGPGTGVQDGAPKLDKVVWKAVPDELTRLGDLERGKCHIIQLGPDLIGQAVKPGFYVPDLGPVPVVTYLGLNTGRFPFNNKLIRNAAVRAVDYDSIIQIYSGQADRWQMPIPNGFLSRDPTIPVYERNLEEAKRLMTEAGYPDGKGIPELRLVFPTDIPLEPRISELVQSNLAEIGLKLKLEGMTSPAQQALISGAEGGDDPRYPDFFYEEWGWYPDEFAFVDWFIAKPGFGSSNTAWYSTPEVEELLSRANSAPSQEERFENYSKISRIVYEDAPYIPVVQLKNSSVKGIPVVSEKVQGVITNLGDWVYWANWNPVYFVE